MKFCGALSIIFLSFAAFFCASAFAVLPPWIVQISSSYQTDAGDFTQINGSGTLVQIGDKKFVLSDSHLSQGVKDLAIRLIDGSFVDVKLGERLADNNSDLELIEVSGEKLKPALTFNDGKFSAPAEEKELSDFFPVAGYSYIAPAVPWVSGDIHPWYPRERLKKSYGGSTLNDNAVEGPREIAGGYETVSDVGIRPGQSGAPMLHVQNSKIILEGLCKGYNRFYDQAYFSTQNEIKNLVVAFQQGKRGQLNNTRWKFGKFTYRDFGNGTLETVSQITPAGSIVHGEAGNGASGDGGKNLLPELKPQDLHQGMIYEGKEIYGFHVKFPNAKLNDKSVELDVYADASALLWVQKLKDQGSAVEITPIANAAPIFAVIEKYLPAKNDKADGACLVDKGKLRDGILRIRLPYDSSDTTHSLQSLQFDLKKNSPFVEFTSKTGKHYKIDIRGLSYAPVQDLNVPGFADFELINRSHDGFTEVASHIDHSRPGVPFEVDAWSLTTHPNTYISVQVDQGARQRFQCFEAGWFSFFGAQDFDFSHQKSEATLAPCEAEINVNQPINSLLQDTASILTQIPDGSPLGWYGEAAGKKINFNREKKILTWGESQAKEYSFLNSSLLKANSAQYFSGVLPGMRRVVLVPNPGNVPHSFWFDLEKEIISDLPANVVIKRHNCSESALWNQGAILYEYHGLNSGVWVSPAPSDASIVNVYCHVERSSL